MNKITRIVLSVSILYTAGWFTANHFVSKHVHDAALKAAPDFSFEDFSSGGFPFGFHYKFTKPVVKTPANVNNGKVEKYTISSDEPLQVEANLIGTAVSLVLPKEIKISADHDSKASLVEADESPKYTVKFKKPVFLLDNKAIENTENIASEIKEFIFVQNKQIRLFEVEADKKELVNSFDSSKFVVKTSEDNSYHLNIHMVNYKTFKLAAELSMMPESFVNYITEASKADNLLNVDLLITKSEPMYSLKLNELKVNSKGLVYNASGEFKDMALELNINLIDFELITKLIAAVSGKAEDAVKQSITENANELKQEKEGEIEQNTVVYKIIFSPAKQELKVGKLDGHEIAGMLTLLMTQNPPVMQKEQKNQAIPEPSVEVKPLENIEKDSSKDKK